MSRRLNVSVKTWPLKNPFRITGKVFEAVDAVTVEIAEYDCTGKGEGVGVYYLNETAVSIVDQIEHVRAHIEGKASRRDFLDLLPPGGARNAIDCALWDLHARQAGKSVSAITGIDSSRPVRTVWTVGIEETPALMAENASRAAAFPTLKVKLDGEQPVERMQAVRKARPDAQLVIDANQGFTFEQLREVLPAFQKLDVSMVEQPLPRGADDALSEFISPIPLCADESCLSLEELPGGVSKYDMINIKLDKCGGLTEALEIEQAARRAGKKVMVGNMIGTSLSMAPALVLARVCDFVDLDGPLHLKQDYPNGIAYDGALVDQPTPEFWGSPAGH